MPAIKPRTPQEARDWLLRHGIAVTDWARAHGFEPTVVFSLLNGRTRGLRGQAHLAAIALGLKQAPELGEPSPLECKTTTGGAKSLV